MTKLHLGFSALLAISLIACGENDKPNNPDAAPPVDAAPEGFQKPQAIQIRIAPMNPDQIHSVVAGPNGSFYIAGFFTRTPTGPRILSVVKVQRNGMPDTTFGDGGNAYVETYFTSGINDETDLAVQADGKILVSTSVPASPANPLDAADRDIAVVRLLTSGARDPDFGTAGVVHLALGTGVTGQAGTYDGVRSIAVNASGIYLHANSRGVDPNNGDDLTHSDFVVLKLAPTNGALDTTFGNSTIARTAGQFRLDIGEVNATPRQIQALPDGKLLVSGYVSSSPVLAGKTQPVLYKLTTEGKLDTTFAATATIPGVFHSAILVQQTEVYGFAIHGDKIVTAGYGRNDILGTAPNSYVSLRFNISDGVRDLTWGGAGSNGAVVFDPSGTGLTSNCRFALALPEGKTLLIGSTGQNGTQPQDAVFAVLDAEGKLDTKYGTGLYTYKLGADGFDQFWSAALTTDNNIIVVGWSAVATQSAATNDESYGLLFKVQ